MVKFPVHDHIETFDRVFNVYQCPLQTCKSFRNVERLGEETLNSTSPMNDKFIVVAEFVHTKDSDDVLQLLVSLKSKFHSLCAVVMFLTNDVSAKDTRSRIQRVNGRVDTKLGYLAAQHRRGVKVSEGCCRSRVGKVI